MENLHKLKELEYLNLALNNISRIEGIEACESLKKLDMTVNFIDVFEIHDSLACLGKLPSLKELYLTGNPCEEWPGCKDYAIASVPSLECYNGEAVTPSQRIKAQQNLEALRFSLFQAIERRKLDKKKEAADEEERRRVEETLSEEEKAKMKTPYTKEVRREMYEQMYSEKEKKEREKNPEKYKQEPLSEMYTKEGEIRQCNEGRFRYRLKEYEDPDYSFFEIEVPRHLETSELTVNINPHWVSVRVKKQLTQLKLSEEIVVHESKTERSKITGFLLVTLKKMHSQEFLRKNRRIEEEKLRKEESARLSEEKSRKEGVKRLCEEYEKRMEKEEDELPDLE